MKAALLQRSRITLNDNRFAEIVIWQLPEPVNGCTHTFKYRLALVEDAVCVVRYDNEAGKGDHKYIGAHEVPYVFTTPDQLVDDFWADIAEL